MPEFDIPEPFNSEKFQVFQKGISDHPSIDVYINERRDFLFLHPTPKTDYETYIQRVKKYSLAGYKENLQVIQRRLQKIEHRFENKPLCLLEIGAGEGSFLKSIRQNLPKIHLTAVDKDQNTLHLRVKNSDKNYNELDELLNIDKCYEYICLFHVFEHLLSPSDFLAKISGLMFSTSLLIIEIPSFSDPLLSLYGNQAYPKFYFQSQHPYVYSQSSLQRLMEYHCFQTVEVIHYQRYGLENHLNWLTKGPPGGNPLFQKLFTELESPYLAALERCGKTDTVIWMGKAAN